MSLHIGEVTSAVSVEGVPAASAASAGAGPVPPWELRERHRRLSEELRDEAQRTAGEGFDG
jgi:hypothetical protein